MQILVFQMFKADVLLLQFLYQLRDLQHGLQLKLQLKCIIFGHHGKYKVNINLLAGISLNLIKIEFGQQLITTLR